MSSAIFVTQMRITYAHCTVGNHVYYSRYLEFLESARGDLFRHLGVSFLDWQSRDTSFPVIECRLRYHEAARYDDVVQTELWLIELGKVRLNFAYRMKRPSGAVILEGETFHVCASGEGRPKRMPPELGKLLEPYLIKPG